MRLLIAFLFPLAAFCAEPNIAKIPWPKMVCEFPQGDPVSFTSGRYEIRFRVPDDPKIQSSGGSGGPIVEIKLRDRKSGWSSILTEQSVGQRLLESYNGRPQIEIWGRGGGGYWSRELYRFLSGEYRSVRIDDFEERPRHHNENAPTAAMPNARQGKGDQQSDVLYFIETRLP